MIACETSNNNVLDHFSQLGKMVNIGFKMSRMILDYKLGRYACYLIVQNANPRKKKFMNILLTSASCQEEIVSTWSNIFGDTNEK